MGNYQFAVTIYFSEEYIHGIHDEPERIVTVVINADSIDEVVPKLRVRTEDIVRLEISVIRDSSDI